MRWFHEASEPLRGLRITSAAEIIDTHYWERDVLVKAFFEITGIHVEHDVIHVGNVVRRITEQMLTGRILSLHKKRYGEAAFSIQSN